MGQDEFGQRMNNIEKYVVSSTLPGRGCRRGARPGCCEATWWPRSPGSRRSSGGNLLVEGSAQLVQTLVQHDMVDEYRLMIFPIVLGAGKRMFPPSMPQSSTLEVTNSQTVGSGVLLLNLSARSDPAR